ncbi:MAG TPA: hypothetical protein PKK20_08925 [Verrucomicrobiota bacterium]|nr:hypothetical protein [Verrucomicrobiota bacterium]HNV00047.1 hypothetical protein [Verrucomicrobiota bacterium]HOF48600.1 hypothetical protein [Verrucomicrobiota bacterium]HOR70773.1 hypothetical protein [Verrucomicrobiota bacterium]HPK97474.1 hypothetical protein [Verrucomicrobiota bacterium]
MDVSYACASRKTEQPAVRHARQTPSMQRFLELGDSAIPLNRESTPDGARL